MAWFITLFSIIGIEICAGRAVRGIVELDEEKIEPRGLDGMCQVSIRDDTLRRTGDVVLLPHIRCEIDPQSVNHGSISAILGRSIVVRDSALNIKIKSINDSITERSRAVIGCIHGSKSIPQEFGKRSCRIIVLDRLIVRNSSSQGEKDLLAHGLACLDIRSNERAVGKQGACGAIFVFEGLRTALVPKVCTRVTAIHLVWKDVQKSDRDDIDAGIGAEMCQAWLIRSLTLVTRPSAAKQRR